MTHKWSVTVRPYRLGDASKDTTMAWAVPALTAGAALARVAAQLEDQPQRRSVVVTVERTDS